MNERIVAALCAAAAGIAVLLCARTVRRLRRQVAEMAEMLCQVRDGNGNRRFLAGPHELAAPLAYAVNELVVSYEDRLAALRRTERAQKRLMTGLSHDVRTPLTTLTGYLDAACREDGEERARDLQTALRKAGELRRAVDALFDWFRLNSGEYALHLVPVEAGELTRTLLADWVPVLEESAIAYEISIPDRPVSARLDPDGYARIVNNLIRNAVTHSRAGRLTVALTCEGGGMALRVADDGVGIGEEALGHIFERLYRADSDPSAKGSGLGLSIARELARQMGGALDARSAPGQGTEFTLTFPAEG